MAAAARSGLAVARTTLRPGPAPDRGRRAHRGTGNLRERTDARRSDELGRLARAFNTMLDALDALGHRAETARRRRLPRAADAAGRRAGKPRARSSSTRACRRGTSDASSRRRTELREMTASSRSWSSSRGATSSAQERNRFGSTTWSRKPSPQRPAAHDLTSTPSSSRRRRGARPRCSAARSPTSSTTRSNGARRTSRSR